MQKAYLIKGGTVVDGTGAPAFAADVRVKDGFIVEIGKDLPRQERERLIEANGCYVTPGFIEAHNHYDGPMWWNPTLDPMPSYGVTTSVNGNCGFTAAPVPKDEKVRKEIVRIFSFFEDIPEKPFLTEPTWDWNTWSEYKRSVEKNVKLPINFAAFTGHLATRLAVMGMDAWERAATPDEIKQMCDLFVDALDAGALGISSNLLDNDNRNRPIPTKLACDAEWTALMDVLERYPGRTLQVIVDYVMRRDAPETMARITRLAKGKKIRIQLAGSIPTLGYQKALAADAIKMHEAHKANGQDVWTSYAFVAPTILMGFINSLAWAQQNNYVWNEIIETPTEEEKLAKLASEEWRARARDSWDAINPVSRAKDPDSYILFDSETGAGPTGITLRQFQLQAGYNHPSDALADWVLENGVNSNLKLQDIPKNEEVMDYMFNDSNSIGNLSDAGAHGKMMAGVGDNVMFLTKYVRDQKRVSIEQAVHIMTGKIAGHFGFLDRGVLEVGKRADIVVFDINEIERRPEFKMFDVPDGEGGRTFRYSRLPAPMRLTMCNGVATFDKGSFTGNFPGQHITGEAPPPAYAQAAE